MKRNLIGIILVSIFVSSFMVPNALAFTYSTLEKCGKMQTSQDGNPYPTICKDGHPNSQAQGVLSSITPRIMKLASSSSNSAAISAICTDVPNATFPILYSAYNYQYVRFGWGTPHITPDGMEKRLVGSTLCNNKASAIVPIVQRLRLPDFRGHTMKEVDSWKLSNNVKMHILYSTAIGYSHLNSCQMAKQGNVLSQNRTPNSTVVNSPATTVWLYVDC